MTGGQQALSRGGNASITDTLQMNPAHQLLLLLPASHQDWAGAGLGPPFVSVCSAHVVYFTFATCVLLLFCFNFL